MKRLREILKELYEIKEEANLKFSDDILFEQSIKIYISENINNSKNTGLKILNKTFEQKKQESKESILASNRQKWKLKQLGIKFNKDITKQEAYHLIRKKEQKE